MSGSAASTAEMMPSIISGIAATIAAMISGSAPTRETSSVMPACMICGIAPRMKSTMLIMIAGSAAMSWGRAARMPSTSARMICSATSRMRGKLSTMPFTTVTIAFTAAGISFGSAFVMPSTSEIMISTPHSRMSGSASIIVSTSSTIISITVSTRVGRRVQPTSRRSRHSPRGMLHQADTLEPVHRQGCKRFSAKE